MLTYPKKRGRPRKNPLPAAAIPQPPAARDAAEILEDLNQRFSILELLTKGAIASNIRSLVVTGAPGVGKTYTVESLLEASGVPHEVVRGSLSAVNLYKLGYRMHKPGSVIVLDDADSIFNDEEALNILKALCDSSVNRTVSWLKDSQSLKDEEVPTSYTFDGAMIFISNLDFQQFVDEGRNKYSQHFEALMSRSLYLDLRLHNRDELAVWVSHIANEGRIFAREGIEAEVGHRILDFITEHKKDLRELSIRTLLKACQLAKTQPDTWEPMAEVLLCK